jgi:hypothetical protein
MLLFLFLTYTGQVTAERDIGNYIDLPQAQLQQLELNNFKVLGLIQLAQDAGQDRPLMEFSGLAWDHDENSLIILSDRGFLIHTKPIFSNGKLIEIKLLSYHHLRDKNGKKLKYTAADSEGLALINSKNNIIGDTELIISFERQPRIIRYANDGTFIADEPLNNELNDIKNYAASNKALEAVTIHNQFNIITGPERPLKSQHDNLLSLHTLEKETWYFTPDSENYGSLVGLTTLPDNRLITLERIFSSIFGGLSNAIHLITLGEDTIKAKKIVSLAPSASYFNDNFEGISWHKENRFFMISDDNDNIFQKSLLVYFEIPDLDDEE